MYNNVIVSLLLFASRLKFVFTFAPSSHCYMCSADIRSIQFRFGSISSSLCVCIFFPSSRFDSNNQHINVCIIKHIVRSQFSVSPPRSVRSWDKKICDIRIVFISIEQSKKKAMRMVWGSMMIFPPQIVVIVRLLFGTYASCQCNVFTSIKYWTESMCVCVFSLYSNEYCRSHLTGNHLLAANTRFWYNKCSICSISHLIYILYQRYTVVMWKR